VLASDLALPDLLPDDKAPEEAAIHIRLASDQNFPPPGAWFLSMKMPTEDPWLSCAKIKSMETGEESNSYLLRFHELADFLVSAHGRDVLCRTEPGIPLETLHHLILDQVLPLVFNLQGREVLHATAVCTPWGVCAFTGETGVGKSTLAASFLSAGYPILSDDCLVMQEAQGQILAMPAYPGVRLWDDSIDALGSHLEETIPVSHYTTKRRWLGEGSEDFTAQPHPLARVYCLHRQKDNEGKADLESPTIDPLSPRDGFLELLSGTFRLDITDRAMLVRQFRFLEQVASQVPIRRLGIPNNFASLPAMREAILRDLSNG
jgi:hypothetical protein